MQQGLAHSTLLHRLAARIMWRVEREGSGLTEGCLVSVDDLQNHVEHFGEEEQKELRLDVDTFLQYWPPQSQQFSMQYISHIFGVVRKSSLNLEVAWGGGGQRPQRCQVREEGGHFPRGPVVNTSPSKAGDAGSIPGCGAKITRDKIKKQQPQNKTGNVVANSINTLNMICIRRESVTGEAKNSSGG